MPPVSPESQQFLSYFRSRLNGNSDNRGLRGEGKLIALACKKERSRNVIGIRRPNFGRSCDGQPCYAAIGGIKMRRAECLRSNEAGGMSIESLYQAQLRLKRHASRFFLCRWKTSRRDRRHDPYRKRPGWFPALRLGTQLASHASRCGRTSVE